jgi:hypothetical protein
MTLLIAVPVGALLGLVFGARSWVMLTAFAVWYACLAVQTAYLAHPGRTGFLGVDALSAVQGAGFAQYWLAQPLIAALMIAGLVAASRLRRRHGTGGTPPAG